MSNPTANCVCALLLIAAVVWLVSELAIAIGEGIEKRQRRRKG